MEGPVDRELKRGTLEMLLLKLLAERPMYGYELVSELEAKSAGVFALKEGTLYPVLYRLEDGRLIEPRWEVQERGVPRKYYSLTDAGKKRLESLIAEWLVFSKMVNYLLEEEGQDVSR